MKRILLSMMAVAAMLTTSCVKGLEDNSAAGQETTVTFSVATPEIATRAFSDGTTATGLQYAVYDAQGNHLPKLDGETTINISTTVELQLTTGNSYSVIFWAAAPSAPYTVDFPSKTMTVDYEGAKSNDEVRDAFYAYHSFTVNGAQTETVKLYRPFAQLNIGTSDYSAAADAGYVPTTSAVTVKNVYTTLNLADGKVADPVEVEFASNAIPTAETFPVAGNEYIAMNYLLVAADKELVDVEFTYSDAAANAKTRTVGSVPVQRNYRTNIYGQLLTSDVDINVEIVPEYLGDELEAWDGTTLNEPDYDAATGTYKVSHAAELAYLAALVNGTLDTDMVSRAAVAADNLAGKTISLECDINLNGKEWTPIGVGQTRFHGTIEGNNFTIHGLKVTQRHGGYSQAALVGNVAGTVAFRNFTIKGASIECPDFSDDYYGSAVVGTMYGNVTFENVNVVDSYLSGNNKVGALVAHDGVCSSLEINGCNVTGTVFEALNTADGGSVGGLVGYFQGVPKKDGQAAPYGEHHIYNSSVKNCVFNVVNSTNTGKRANAQLVGGLDSKLNQILYIDDCVLSGNEWNEKYYADGAEVTDEISKFALSYGVWVGGERNDEPDGKVIIDGVEWILLIPIIEEGKVVPGVGIMKRSYDENGILKCTYGVTAPEGLDWVAKQVNGSGVARSGAPYTFEGETVKLLADIDLAKYNENGGRASNTPIGTANLPFKGTLDGNGKTISNLYQSGWDLGYQWGTYGSIGLFSSLDNATVKNVILDGFEAQIEGGDISFVSGSATGTCVFENIEIKNGKIGTYNNGIGSIIGWSGAGEYTFKNITIGSDVVLGGLWGSFDSSVGGVVGQAEPGATYNFENVEISCRLDVYNDCTASYDYYNYRMCGMIIGRCAKTTTINGANYPDLSQYNITCKNVTVNFGDWMNYHYCDPTPGLNGGRGMRVEPGYAYDGLPADFDHTLCTAHHMACIPFDGLIGGDQLAVKALKQVDGVTVNYPSSYKPE